MIHKSYLVALRRETNVADPATGLVQNLADGILQPVPAIDTMRHGEFAPRTPVGPAYVLENLAGRAAGQRSACQHSVHQFQARSVNSPQLQRQFVVPR